MIMIINKEIIMTSRNTKQKEIILDILQANRIHPTIHEIYELAKEKYPSIGQATVYRNINKLVDEGILLKIPTTNNFRYDINTHTHAHLTCKECGGVVDLFDGDYQKIVINLESKYNVKIDDTNLIFNGLCNSCNTKE